MLATEFIRTLESATGGAKSLPLRRLYNAMVLRGGGDGAKKRKSSSSSSVAKKHKGKPDKLRYSDELEKLPSSFGSYLTEKDAEMLRNTKKKP